MFWKEGKQMLFERDDWKQFRNIDTLKTKAGVSGKNIKKVVIKELVDNALDAGYSCEVGTIGSNGFYVEDDGDGLPLESLDKLFSVNRSLVSSKLVRLPSRGALGNGLRVVVGSVLALGGKIFVETKGSRFEIKLDEVTGESEAVLISCSSVNGTRIEVIYDNQYISKEDLQWGQDAITYKHGTKYKGKTSPHWYTSESFFELVNSFQGSIRELVTMFDGCTGAKAGVIASNYKGLKAGELTQTQTEEIFTKLRESSSKFNPERLSTIGELDSFNGYHKTSSFYMMRSVKGENAIIPYVIEVFANVSDKPKGKVLVNKTPITDDIRLQKNGRELFIFGGNLGHRFNCSPAEIVINISTPYMTITTDGKKPDLTVVLEELIDTIQKSVKKAKRKEPKQQKKRTTKEIIYYNMADAINKTSGHGQYRFSQRQLFYSIRPYVMEELGKEPDYNYFCTLLTEYELEYGDIELLYRDVRGVLYEPHTKQDIPLGTLAVENYQRPKLTYNKILYSEKEGFFTILKSVNFPERHDMALLTSKGYASRAAKDLIDMLGETNEEITFFCIHDADASGTKIFESLQEATKSRPGRKVKIINLGLDPEEALEMELEVEEVTIKGKKPVGDYLDEHWKEWLQNKRVELNAMTTPQFLEWLERKIRQYDKGKIIPHNDILIEELKHHTKEHLQHQVRERILKEANYESQVMDAYNKIIPTVEGQCETIKKHVEDELSENPVQRWDAPVRGLATNFKI